MPLRLNTLQADLQVYEVISQDRGGDGVLPKGIHHHYLVSLGKLPRSPDEMPKEYKKVTLTIIRHGERDFGSSCNSSNNKKRTFILFFAYFTLKKMSKVKANSMAEFGLSLPKLVLGVSHKREINFGFLFKTKCKS